MKQILLILGLMLTSISFAQDVRFGVHGGLNFANIDYELSQGPVNFGIDTDVRTSFYLGGIAEFSLPNMEHKLQTGLSLNFNGFKFENSVPGDFEEESNIRITQLNIPILFKFNAYEGLYINGGAYVGFIVHAEEEYREKDFFFDESFKETETITDDFKTIDFGLSFGAEYNLESGLFFEARYNLGLTNIANVEEEDDDFDFGNESLTVKNRFFMFGVGYKF